MKKPDPPLQAFLDAFNAARALHSTGQYAEAEAAYRRALRIRPDVPLLYANLGLAISQQGRLEEALTVQRKAVKLDPRLAFAHAHLGTTLAALERHDEAVAALRTAITLDPKDPAYHNNLAEVFMRGGKLEEGLAQLKQALALDPQSLQALYNTGVVYFRLQQFSTAVGYLERVVAMQPHNISFLALLVISQRETGQNFNPALLRLLQAQPTSQGDLQTRVWAALIAGHPKIAFATKPAGLCLLDYDELGKLHRPADLAARLAKLPEVTGSWPQANGRLLITASADGKYAEMFAQDLIKSILTTCPGCDFHLHLMNPGRFELKGYPPDRVTWTAETIPGGERTVYSTRRFLRLPQLLARAERPVISVDMDSIFNRDLAEALPQRFDVLLYERRDQPWPQQMVNAGFLAIAPSGRDFATFLAAYILHFEEKGEAKWFVDQLGIVAARAWFHQHEPQLSILAVAPHMMDWSERHDPQSIIWHYKGALKTASGRSR